MHILRLPFNILTITGAWMPDHWSSRNQKLLWFLFSSVCLIAVALLVNYVTAWLLCSKSLKDFSERLFFVPTGISSIHKYYTFIIYRKELINLGNMLMKQCCIPKNFEEIMILYKYDEFIRVITLACIILVNITLVNMISIPVITQRSVNWTLPVDVLLPYEINSNATYWLTYFQQMISILLVGNNAVGGTLMINGLIYQVCAQIEILTHRFHKLPRNVEKFQSLNKPSRLIYEYERNIIRENIRHHLYIFRMAESINETFKPVLFQQFCLSAIVISASVYHLSIRQEKDLALFMVFCYLMCTLTEFLVYSWFGNELMQESLNFQDSIYATDWTPLSINSSRDLIFIMLRASKPMYMSCGHFIVLSLESYIGILKISYSVFNVLSMSTDQ